MRPIFANVLESGTFVPHSKTLSRRKVFRKVLECARDSAALGAANNVRARKVIPRQFHEASASDGARLSRAAAGKNSPPYKDVATFRDNYLLRLIPLRGTQSRSEHAFTRKDLLVILGVLALIILLLIPTVAREVRKANRITCVNHMMQIAISARVFADDNTGKFPWQVVGDPANIVSIYQIESNYLNATIILACPSDNRYAANDFRSLQAENISYFVGLDSTEESPAMFLGGDRNILTNGAPVPTGIATVRTNDVLGWSAATHHGVGNVALTDGSVQEPASPQLQENWAHQGTNPAYRLLFP